MRRLNVKLLLWLVGTAIVAVVGIFGLWTFQRSRTAGSLLQRADKYAAEKKYTDALKEYDRYFRFRDDDTDNYIRYALLHDEYSRLPDATLEDRARAVQHLKGALVKDPSQVALKRKVADQLLEFGAFSEATGFLKELVQTEQEQVKLAELEALLARCYVRSNEVDKAVELYQKSLQHDPKRVPTYVSLADLQRTRLSKPQDANKTLDLAIERNPDDHRGYVARARAKYEDDFENAKKDVEKALSLAPTDPDAVLLGADVALKSNDVELARRRLDAGREANPEDSAMIITSSKMEAAFDPKKAEAILNEGIKRMPKKIELLFSLAELQLSESDLDGAKKTLEAMRKKQQPAVPPPYLKLIEARILMAEGSFERASRLLEEARGPLARTQWGTQVNTYLSQCHMAVGRPDRQLAAAQEAFQLNPESAEAKVTLAAAYEANRNRTEALKLYRTMLDRPAIQLKVAQMMIADVVDLPEKDRNWDEVSAFIQDIRSKGAADMPCNLLEAQVLKHRGNVAEAAALLEKNRDAHPEQIQSWLALYDVTKEAHGSEKAGAVLGAAIEKFGNTPELKAKALQEGLTVEDKAAREKAVEKLKGDLAGMTDEREKIQALLMLGEQAFRAGKPDEARGYWLQVAEMRPKEGGILVGLFKLARLSNNVEDMQDTVQKIREAKGPKSYEYLLTASSLDIFNLMKVAETSGKLPGPEQKSKLLEIRQQLQTAEQQHSGNPDLAQLDGELSQLEGDIPRAIEAYRKCTKTPLYGPLNTKRLVMLLGSQGREAEALSEIERMDSRLVAGMDLRKTQIALLTRANRAAEAAPLIDQEAADAKDWRSRLWVAKRYEEANKQPEAETQYRAALAEAPPEAIDPYWVMVEYLVERKGDLPGAVQVVEEAKKRVAPEEQPLLLGKCYETLKDYELARRSYEQALAARPKDLRVLGAAIGFYKRQNQTDDAMAMLDQMIATSLNSDKPEEKQNAAWARRVKAQYLTTGGQYQDTLQAIELINQNEKDGLASADDLSLKAALLADRPDRKSRLEAKAIFEKLIPLREDSSRERFALAKIYEREGDWKRARTEFLAVLGQRGDDPKMIYEFCQMLLRHNEVGDVPRWLTRLDELSPGAPEAKEVRGRVLAVQGKKKEAAEVLDSLVTRPVTADRARDLLVLANIYGSLSMTPEEEKAYREFYALLPEEHLVLAGFLARHGNLPEVMELCQKAAAASREPVAITQVAVGAIQSQPGAAREQDYKQIEQWISDGLKRDPKSHVLQLHLADFRYGQGRYDEAEKLYREYLARPEVTGAARAGALNNLAFVMSLRDKQNAEKLGEAQKMIDEAIGIAGPVSELLDTRGMVLLSRNKTADAIKDLNEAATDRPSGIKFFHLALAQQAAGDIKAADQSFRRARELGFNKEQCTTLELPAYAALEKALVSG